MEATKQLHQRGLANQPETCRTIEDLEYQVAPSFRKNMYAVSRRLPDFEKYGLASQIRRAAVSLTNNIAEGHGRFHYLEQIKFTLNSRGSLEELIDDLNVCEDESYAPSAELDRLRQEAWRVHKLIIGYIRWLRQKKQSESLSFHESSPAYGLCDEDLEQPIGNASTL